jgi:hypothetical protein
MENKYLVDFKQEINKMHREKSVLIPFFSNDGSRSFFEKLYFQNFFKHCHHCFELELSGKISLLRNLLNSDDYFDNELFQILFNAFVFAESKFIHNFIPQNSHEERLTGHLISEYISVLEIVKNTFQAKAFELYNENFTLEFHYTDLSANNREKITGADFGILFHINLPDYPEEVRAIILQAKKFKTNATIDIKQCKTLKNFAEEGAYYCFYDMNIPETSSPLVLNAKQIGISDDTEQKTIQYSRGELFNNWRGGIPLSIFLIFNLLSECGENSNFKSFKNIWEAKNFFEGERRDGKNLWNKSYQLDTHKPNKLFLVSIGGLRRGQDLRSLSDLYKFSTYED